MLSVLLAVVVSTSPTAHFCFDTGPVPGGGDYFAKLLRHGRERAVGPQPGELERRRQTTLEHLVRTQRRIEETILMLERGAQVTIFPEYKQRFRASQVELRQTLERLRQAERELREGIPGPPQPRD